MKKNLIFIVTLLTAGAILLSSCGAPSAQPTKAATAPIKVALLTYGLVTGDPWNALGYAGLNKAKETLGVETALTDNLDTPDFEAALRDYASQNYNLVIGHSFGFGDPAVAVAKDFPNTFFVINTGAVSAANVASINVQDQENGYLTGALAAMVTKTGTIGILGGFDYPSVIKEINGYYDGAKAINPDIKVLVGYVGSWDDPAKAQELAQAMISQGADVLSHKAGGSGLGVIKAAEVAGVWAINDVATCQETSPTACLTSTDIKFDNIVINTIQLYQQGKLEGKIYSWGIKDGAADIGPINSKVPADIVNKIMDLRQQIIDGKLVIPEKWDPGWQ